MSQQARITVRGTVQGVAFRAYTREMAASLGVCGYVRNLADGSVEIVAEGDEGPLKELIEWAQRGPPSAVIESIDVGFSEPTNTFRDFRIRH